LIFNATKFSNRFLQFSKIGTHGILLSCGKTFAITILFSRAYPDPEGD
jgi:hypothetical protein